MKTIIILIIYFSGVFAGWKAKSTWDIYKSEDKTKGTNRWQ